MLMKEARLFFVVGDAVRYADVYTISAQPASAQARTAATMAYGFCSPVRRCKKECFAS